MAPALAHQGRRDAAAACLAAASALRADAAISAMRAALAHADNPAVDRYFQGLRRAGAPE